MHDFTPTNLWTMGGTQRDSTQNCLALQKRLGANQTIGPSRSTLTPRANHSLQVCKTREQLVYTDGQNHVGEFPQNVRKAVANSIRTIASVGKLRTFPTLPLLSPTGLSTRIMQKLPQLNLYLSQSSTLPTITTTTYINIRGALQ